MRVVREQEGDGTMSDRENGACKGLNGMYVRCDA